MEYTDAMKVLGPLYENGEWPELKEKIGNEEVRIALRGLIDAYLEMTVAYEAYSEVAYNNPIYRRLKSELEKATEELSLAHDELMNLLE